MQTLARSYPAKANTELRDWTADGIAVAALLILALALYRKVVDLWWTYDDAYLLHTALTALPSQYLVDTHLWRSMPGHMFVPLLPMTYDGMLGMLGFATRWWHSIQLLFAFLFALTWYALLRLWLSVPFSLLGATLLLAGVPLCSVAAQLMLVHYLECGILSSLCGILYVWALRRSQPALAILSASAYLAAMLAKEIAVPLIVILLILPEGDFRARRSIALPHAVALLVYVGWRIAMIGTVFGGYGWAVTRAELPGVVAAIPWKLLKAFAGPDVWSGTVCLLMIGIGFAVAVRNRTTMTTALIALALAIAPIVPVSKELQPRYALLSWLVVSTVFVVGVSSMRRRGSALFLGIAAAVVLIIANRQEWKREYSKDLRMSVEARGFLDLGPADILRNPQVPPAAMGELQWLKEKHFHKSAGSAWFYDDFFLCSGGEARRRFWEYDSQRHAIRDITSTIAFQRQHYCTALRDAPLSVVFRSRGDALFWRFGPYRDGSWRVLLGNGAQAFDVPREDGFRLGGVPAITLRVRYTSPTGWVTYSPEMTVNLRQQPDTVWSRGS